MNENELIKESLILKDEILFLITDLIHQKNNLKKLKNKDLSEIGSVFRSFTKYGGKVILTESQIEDLNNLKLKLKNEMWVKVYGKTYDEFKM